MSISIPQGAPETRREGRVRHIVEDLRASVARIVSALGQAVCRLGNRIDECAFDGNEHTAWQSGWNMAEVYYRTTRTTRDDVVRLLERLGEDTSDATLAKLGFGR